MKPVTYDDLRDMEKKLMKDHEVKPKIFVLSPTFIEFGIREKVIRVDGKRMFFTNLLYPGFNGCEVFSTEYMADGVQGMEVSKVIFDEFKEEE